MVCIVLWLVLQINCALDVAVFAYIATVFVVYNLNGGLLHV